MAVSGTCKLQSGGPRRRPRPIEEFQDSRVPIDNAIAPELNAPLAGLLGEGRAVPHEQLAHVHMAIECRKVQRREPTQVGNTRVSVIVDHEANTFHLVTLGRLEELLRRGGGGQT